jgi:NAD-dependent dihydropyrimidine dehydrogenase PreA subunit
MSAAQAVGRHDWYYHAGPVRRNRFFWREARCLGCGAVETHRADEPAPQDYRCSVIQPVHAHDWADEHITELTMDGRQVVFAQQSCLGCRQHRTVKRLRTPRPVGNEGTIKRGRYG